MTRAFLISIVLLLNACSQSGGGGGSTSGGVQGLDLSGNWRIAGVECYDSSFQSLTAVGVVASGSAATTVSISGNTMSSSSLSNTCRVNQTRTITATLVSGTRANGYGKVKFGAGTDSVVGGGSCSQTMSFNVTQGTISPSTLTSNTSDGDAVASLDTEFIINTNYFALPSLLQTNQPSDICLLIYQKL